MVHAVIAREMDYASLPNWFREGTAEFIHGADERLSGDITAAGSITNLINNNRPSAGWVGDSAHYSTGYAEVKYLDSVAAGGIKAILTALSSGDSLNTAINR